MSSSFNERSLFGGAICVSFPSVPELYDSSFFMRQLPDHQEVLYESEKCSWIIELDDATSTSTIEEGLRAIVEQNEEDIETSNTEVILQCAIQPKMLDGLLAPNGTPASALIVANRYSIARNTTEEKIIIAVAVARLPTVKTDLVIVRNTDATEETDVNRELAMIKQVICSARIIDWSLFG